MSLSGNLFIRGIFNFRRIFFGYKRSDFGYIDSESVITPPIFIINPKNVFIGRKSSLGPWSHISAPNAKFIVKDNCAIAERLTVHTGNHARIQGCFVTDITEENKPDGFDADVTVNEDVWIGSNVTLLSGVTVGRGSTIAAGAVVNRDVPPYCIAGGVPARFIKFIWTIDEILAHEAKLYPEGERLSREYLESVFKKHK